MITICTIMRIELGIWLRIIEMNMLENAVTNVSAIDMTRAVFRFEVTARAEQIPRICSPMGLLLKIGLKTTSLIVGCDMFTPPQRAAWRGTDQSPFRRARNATGYSRRYWSGSPRPGHRPDELPRGSAGPRCL